MPALRAERGQTSAEYVGMILVVVAILAAISYSDIGAAISAQVERASCAIATDSSVEDCGAGAGSTAQGGAPASGAEPLRGRDPSRGPALARGHARCARPARRGEARASRGGPFDKALGLVDERSGFKDARQSWRASFEGDFKGARQAISSLIDGDYGSALLSAAFAIPVGGKFLKGGKYAAKGVGWLGRTGAGKALMGRARKVLRRVLREERGGTLPAHAAFNPASPPSKIRGYAISRDGSRHGLEQALGRDAGRGVSPRAMLDAVRSPTSIEPQAAHADLQVHG